MKGRVQAPASRRLGLGFLVWLLAGNASAQPPQVIATSAADRKAIALSETVVVTLALEGPAPLRFDPPPRFLSDESFARWKVEPAGPPEVTAVAGDRARWRQSFRLDPFVPGETVPVTFAPLDVKAGADPQARWVEFRPLTVTVRTAITRPTKDDARPPTGIEELPDPPPTGNPAAWLVGGGALVMALGAVAGWLVRRRRAPPPVPPHEWAAAELDALERAPDAAVADRLAGVVRGFAERRFGIAASRRTTAELLAGSLDADIGRVLERCDLARFAGVSLSADEARELIGAVRGWVNAR